MGISIDAERTFWQNPESFHDKNSRETTNRRSIFQHNKGYIWQSHSQHHIKWKKLGVRDRYPIFPLFTYSIRSLSQRSKTRGINKRDTTRKDRSQTISICWWYNYICEISKTLPENLLELINTVKWQNAKLSYKNLCSPIYEWQTRWRKKGRGNPIYNRIYDDKCKISE